VIVGLTTNHNGRLVLRLSVPGAGAAAVTATARIGHRTARVARKRATARAAGSLRMTLKPSAAARRAVKRQRSLRVSVSVTYRPAGGKAQTARRAVKLRARR
jgi:hypothetical protein